MSFNTFSATLDIWDGSLSIRNKRFPSHFSPALSKHRLKCWHMNPLLYAVTTITCNRFPSARSLEPFAMRVCPSPLLLHTCAFGAIALLSGLQNYHYVSRKQHHASKAQYNCFHFGELPWQIVSEVFGLTHVKVLSFALV